MKKAEETTVNQQFEETIRKLFNKHTEEIYGNSRYSPDCCTAYQQLRYAEDRYINYVTDESMYMGFKVGYELGIKHGKLLSQSYIQELESFITESE